MITSTANAQVKALSKLIKNARARRQQQLYVVEGIRMFRETPKERIKKVYVSESFAKDPAHEGVLKEPTGRCCQIPYLLRCLIQKRLRECSVL